MTYLIAKPTESTSVKQTTSCSNCPQFNDYKENRGRGWCTLFNSVSFSHHPFTKDCKLQRVDESDKLRSEYSEGDKVKLIESAEDHSQWSTYVIVGKKHNPNRYRNSETYLSQADWYYRLATINEPTASQLWVGENEICIYDLSYNINPDGEF